MGSLGDWSPGGQLFIWWNVEEIREGPVGYCHRIYGELLGTSRHCVNVGRVHVVSFSNWEQAFKGKIIHFF